MLFLDRPAEPRCPAETSPSGEGPIALEILGADGDTVTCVG